MVGHAPSRLKVPRLASDLDEWLDVRDPARVGRLCVVDVLLVPLLSRVGLRVKPLDLDDGRLVLLLRLRELGLDVGLRPPPAPAPPAPVYRTPYPRPHPSRHERSRQRRDAPSHGSGVP